MVMNVRRYAAQPMLEQAREEIDAMHNAIDEPSIKLSRIDPQTVRTPGPLRRAFFWDGSASTCPGAAYDWMFAANPTRRGGRMGLPRAFVGFSSTAMHCYRSCRRGKPRAYGIQTSSTASWSSNLLGERAYIKRTCGERIGMAGTSSCLIGEDTKWKYRYVRWETEVALEKDCRIIGVNLDHSRQMVAKNLPPSHPGCRALFGELLS